MRLLSVIMATAVAAAALAGTPDSTLVRQAERAWDSGEYAAAQALYTLVADRNPSDAGATARMIVAGAIRGDSAMASKTVERALSNAVNLDTLLEAVRRDCYSCSIAPYYPQLLATLGEKMPWLLRPLRLRLLDHSMRRGATPQRHAMPVCFCWHRPATPRCLRFSAKHPSPQATTPQVKPRSARPWP